MALHTAPRPATESQLREAAEGEGLAAVDDFDALLEHLATLHPSRYGALLDGVDVAVWRGVHPLSDQAVALRFVVLVDRLYDRGVRVVADGAPLDEVFTPEMLAGGYRKKYYRALSRLVALARLVGAAGQPVSRSTRASMNGGASARVPVRAACGGAQLQRLGPPGRPAQS